MLHLPLIDDLGRPISPALPGSATTTVMAAVARFLVRGANSKLSLAGIGSGPQSSLGATLLKLTPSCSARAKTQIRNATHFTYEPDPVPTQYGEYVSG